ncbi:MAG: hypothetical protein GY765_29330 [bacterium]|nr:hypothetical protein [bacterium]
MPDTHKLDTSTTNDDTIPSENPATTGNKKSKKKAGFAYLLHKYYKAITITLDSPHMLEVFAGYGYHLSRLREGEALVKAAQDGLRDQHTANTDKKIATTIFNTDFKTAKAFYMELLTIARVAFKNDDSSANLLDLSGLRPKAFAKWAQQATLFFTNAMDTPAVMTGLANYNVSTEKLQQGLDLVENARLSNMDRGRKAVEARNATKHRNETFKAMNNWMSDFYIIARLAFANDMQTLEPFGIVTP